MHASSSRVAAFGIRCLSITLHLGWPHGHSRQLPFTSASAVLAPTYHMFLRHDLSFLLHLPNLLAWRPEASQRVATYLYDLVWSS